MKTLTIGILAVALSQGIWKHIEDFLTGAAQGYAQADIEGTLRQYFPRAEVYPTENDLLHIETNTCGLSQHFALQSFHAVYNTHRNDIDRLPWRWVAIRFDEFTLTYDTEYGRGVPIVVSNRDYGLWQERTLGRRIVIPAH